MNIYLIYQTSRWGGPPSVHKLAEGTSEYVLSWKESGWQTTDHSFCLNLHCALNTYFTIGSMAWKFKLDEFYSDQVVYLVLIILF